MSIQSKIASIYPHILGLFTAVFLLIPHFTTMAILGWIVFLLLSGILKSLKFSWNWNSSLWILLYLLYVVGTIATFHSDIAGKYLEYKLSFVIFPILFSFHPKAKIEIRTTYLWFIGALTALTFMNFFHSFQCGNEISCFLSSQFSYSHHPTYFSAFHFFAISIVLFGYIKKWKYFSLYWILPFLIVSIVSQMLALSLAGILLLGLLAICFLLYKIYCKWGRVGLLIGVIGLPLLFFVFISRTPQIAYDYQAAKTYSKEYVTSPTEFVKSRTYPFSGTEVRLVMWTAAFQTMMKYPLGVGTGNLDDYLGEQLWELDQKNLAIENYNPHNQFLQLGIELGIIGFVFFVLMFFFFARIAWKRKDYIFLLLILSLFFNSLFESMLQRQSGIVFYTFWICFFLQFFNRETQDEP